MHKTEIRKTELCLFSYFGFVSLEMEIQKRKFRFFCFWFLGYRTEKQTNGRSLHSDDTSFTYIHIHTTIQNVSTCEV